MDSLLRDFTGNKRIDAKASGAVNKALATAGTPRGTGHFIWPGIHRTTAACAPGRASIHEASSSPETGIDQLSPRDQRLNFPMTVIPSSCQLDVIPQLRVGIQRQMPAAEVDIICQQRLLGAGA